MPTLKTSASPIKSSPNGPYYADKRLKEELDSMAPMSVLKQAQSESAQQNYKRLSPMMLKFNELKTVLIGEDQHYASAKQNYEQLSQAMLSFKKVKLALINEYVYLKSGVKQLESTIESLYAEKNSSSHDSLESSKRLTEEVTLLDQLSNQQWAVLITLKAIKVSLHLLSVLQKQTISTEAMPSTTLGLVTANEAKQDGLEKVTEIVGNFHASAQTLMSLIEAQKNLIEKIQRVNEAPCSVNTSLTSIGSWLEPRPRLADSPNTQCTPKL